LLLMNGVVYAGFGSHCDTTPFEGWVFGVSTAGHVTARWVSVTSPNGGGIWQSGVGLASDGAGSILLATGNGGAPAAPAPGSSPPASCGECVIRLRVQPNGSLGPVDFFAPFDAAQLDQFDADFGSGGVVGLPDQYFGTSALPHLALAAGKQGYVYLLNRDDLGGFDQGPGGGDGVVERVGPNGGVWGRPGVWPGDGGYVYIATSSGQGGGGLFDVYKYGLSGTGEPSLSLAGNASDVFGWGSGSPVITSDGTTSGSAVVWIIWSANRQGSGGQLRAYDPVPSGGQLRLLYSAAIGNATNYSTPGVGAGRVYVGTRDGAVLAFGSPVTQPLSGSSLTFPRTTVGSSSAPQTLTLTATRSLTISHFTSSSSLFTTGTPSRALPATLSAGQRISVPVTFTPTDWGVAGGQLTAATDAGDVSFSMTGTGQLAVGQLMGNPSILSLGGAAVGGHLSGTVTFSNIGATAVTVGAVRLPGAPFSATGVPAAGDAIAPGASVTIGVSFDPTTVGSFRDAIGLDDTRGGQTTIGLSASAAAPGQLRFSAGTLDFGATALGTSATRKFTITNVGGTAVTITRSKPPFGGAFAATTTLPEGETIAPGQTLGETVQFTPSSVGPAAGIWQINSDGAGAHEVELTGTGIIPGVSTGEPAPSGSGLPAPTGARPSAIRPTAPKFVPALATTARLERIHITYTAAVAGVSRFVLERATAGRRGVHGCVAGTARNRSRARCTRFVVVATFIHRDRVGQNKLRLLAFVAARRLPPGSYRLRSRLRTAGAATDTFSTSLRVLTSPAHRGRKPRVAGLVGDLLRPLSDWLSPLE
jgi:iron transport multicopper oxidase